MPSTGLVFKSNGTPSKTGDVMDIAARYFVYKLYEATDRRPMAWQVLSTTANPRARAGGKPVMSTTNYQEMPLSYVRTPEHRRLRAQLVHRWRPWERSTGPKSAAGKARSSLNAWKGGVRPRLRELGRVLAGQKAVLADLD